MVGLSRSPLTHGLKIRLVSLSKLGIGHYLSSLFLWLALRGLWNLSPLTRDQTQASAVEEA